MATIRRIAQERGAAINAWQNSSPEACQEFRETDGETEFTTDGTSVNTFGGWREMKIGLFSKRHVLCLVRALTMQRPGWRKVA